MDGGVFANNPAMCVYVEARRILEAEDSSDTDILVVSLGTGQLTDRLRYEEAAGWGLLGWARPIIDVVFDGVSDTVDFQPNELLPPSKDRTRRYFFAFRRSSSRSVTPWAMQAQGIYRTSSSWQRP